MNKKFLALVLAITLIPTAAIAATPKPTQAQIDAAKKIEAEKKAAADVAAKKLSSAKKTLQQLTAIATAKRKIYIAAQNDLKMKTKQADIAISLSSPNTEENALQVFKEITAYLQHKKNQ